MLALWLLCDRYLFYVFDLHVTLYVSDLCFSVTERCTFFAPLGGGGGAAPLGGDRLSRTIFAILRMPIEGLGRDSFLVLGGRDQKNNLQSKGVEAKTRWVLHLKDIKNVEVKDAFPASKPRYSYWPKEK